MLRSLYSGISGLRSHQTKMDVIGNNIANVNTTAFKSSRVTFKDVYYQTVSGATSNTALKGGTNPRQIGYGVTVSSIDVINNRGGLQNTDRSLDLYLSGDGYFIVTDNSGATNYTRAGNFLFDVQGALVDANGNYVAGWQPAFTGRGEAVGPIIIPNITDYTNISFGKDGLITGVYSGARPAHVPNTYENVGSLSDLLIPGYTNIRYEGGVLLGDDTVSGMTDIQLFNNIQVNSDGSITGNDMLGGGAMTVLGRTSDMIGNPADYTEYDILTDGTVSALYRGHFTNETEILGSINGPSLTIPGYTDVTFSGGTITGTDNVTGVNTTIYSNVTLLANGDFVGDNIVTGTPGENITALNIDNFVADTSMYAGLTLNANGSISGEYIGAQTPEHIPDTIEVLGQVAVAGFTNPDGLSQQDGIYFQATRNSGRAIITIPGSNGTASIVSGGLEMSNVDLSKEFTDMITTQRGFQANSRIITVSDEMLEELVNLKR